MTANPEISVTDQSITTCDPRNIMLSLLRKSLSGESQDSKLNKNQEADTEDSSSETEQSQPEVRKSKRSRSGDTSNQQTSTKKKKKLAKDKRVSDCSPEHMSSAPEEDTNLPKLQNETSDWGIKLLEIIQGEFKSVKESIGSVESTGKKNSKDLRSVEKKLSRVENRNKALELENSQLKEKLLDLEYRQRWSNLIFKGLPDAPNESNL